MPDTTGSPSSLQHHKPGCLCPPCKRAKETESGGAGKRTSKAKTKARAKAIQNPANVVVPPDQPPVFMEDNSFKARLAQIAAFKAMGLNLSEIADKLDLSYSTVKNIISKGNKLNLIQYDDPFERFENMLIPKVVDNIEYWLNEKDKKMTIEAAKGAGIFKAHQAIKVEGQAPQTVLALKIEMPEASGLESKAIVGHVVGRPRRIAAKKDDVVVEAETK